MDGQGGTSAVAPADFAQMGGGLVQPVALRGICDNGCGLGHSVRLWDGRERRVAEYQFETETGVPCSLLETAWQTANADEW